MPCLPKQYKLRSGYTTRSVCAIIILCMCSAVSSYRVLMFSIAEFLAFFIAKEFATQFITVSADSSAGLRGLIL